MSTPEQSFEMDWKPNKWIAVALGIFFQGLSMLYLARPRWALFYFVLISVIGLTEFWLVATGRSPGYTVLIYWLTVGACVIHSYRLARVGQIPKPRPWYSRWYGLVSITLLVALAISSVRIFFYEPFRLPSKSMEPSFPLGSIVFVTKAGIGNYGAFGMTILRTPMTAKIDRGDVIVFRYPVDPELDYIKRVVGLPGDFVSYKSKILLINGVKIQTVSKGVDGTLETSEERYGDNAWLTITDSDRPPHDFEGKVPEHSYFVLGDNRDNSLDSRYWGFVPEANLIGKVVK